MSSQAGVVERIQTVASQLTQPRTLADLAAQADVAPEAAATFLDSQDWILSAEFEQGRAYCPDPAVRFVDRLRETAGGDLPADSEPVREAVWSWRDPAEIETVEALEGYHLGARLIVASRLPVGRHVYDDDWDVLVVLDTCRVDALRAVADRISGITPDDVEARVSLGSQTAEWISQTFTADREEVAETGYVAGNGWAKGVFEEGLRPDDDMWYDGLDLPTTWDVVDGDDFATLVHAWQRDRGEYTEDVPWAPHPSPRTVTDHAISLARERDLDRLVVHYKQPHAPYTATAERQGREQLARYEGAPFEYLRTGGDPEPVWNAYLRDLAAAVEEIEALRRNVDGRVAITADHGEAFGERGEFAHRPTMLHPQVRQVPWVVVDASDERTREVDLSAYRTADRDVDGQLEALGYR